MKKATSIEMALSLGLYVKRWQRWVAAWLQGIAIIRHNDQQPHKPTIRRIESLRPGALERHLKGNKNIDRFAVKVKG
jgi:hypothetical protein